MTTALRAPAPAPRHRDAYDSLLGLHAQKLTEHEPPSVDAGSKIIHDEQQDRDFNLLSD